MIYRIYDLFRHLRTAWRTLKNCIITGTLKDYWSWFETAIVESDSKTAESLKEQIYYGELYDSSDLEW